MAILGKEAAWGAARKSNVESQIAIACGQAVQTPNCIQGLVDGLSNADVPFLIANIETVLGQTVAVGSHAPGGPAVGTVTSNGVIT